jgi:precorrin-6B methylase 2
VVLLATAEAPLDAQSATARQQEAAREAWQRVPEIFAAMAIGPGAVVADVGAGDGFLTVRLAHAVGSEGRVFAVDVSDQAVDRLRARVQQDALTNVTVVNGDANDPHLRAASLDAAVIVNSYHEMVDYPVMLERVRAALKPTGRLVISEFVSDKRLYASRKQQVDAHEIAARFVEQEARNAGFRIQTLHDPFVKRGDVTEWLIVAVAEAGPEATNSPSSTPATSASEEANPDLRIAFEVFKKRLADRSIVIVDVRSEEEYMNGHIPGAIWVPLESLDAHVERLRSMHKPIVTYCS